MNNFIFFNVSLYYKREFVGKRRTEKSYVNLKKKKRKKRIRECELIYIAHLELTFETNREIHYIMLVLKKVY